MDIRMPELDGIAATLRILRDPTLRQTRVLILTTFDDDELVFDAFRMGASGFLLKDSDHETLLAGIRTVHSGESILSGGITRRLIERRMKETDRARAHEGLISTLTTREHDILCEVARGRTNDEIAVALSITHATAKTHVSRVLAKLQARDRVQLVIIAYEAGLVPFSTV
jgi:DNA-binding NarL/FixJ family response regulator